MDVLVLTAFRLRGPGTHRLVLNIPSRWVLTAFRLRGPGTPTWEAAEAFQGLNSLSAKGSRDELVADILRRWMGLNSLSAKGSRDLKH